MPAPISLVELRPQVGAEQIVASLVPPPQFDGAIAALDALPGVVEAIGDDVPVLMDSGVRSGADAFKALALGARAVGIGRPAMWGLSVAGEDGVRTVIRSLLAELDLTLALSGHTSLETVGPDTLVRG